MKHKRRTLTVILGVFLFAFGIISGVFFVFYDHAINDQTQIIESGVGDDINGATGQTYTSGSHTFTTTMGHYYYVELAGGAGGDSGSYKGGKGDIISGIFGKDWKSGFFGKDWTSGGYQELDFSCNFTSGGSGRAYGGTSPSFRYAFSSANGTGYIYAGGGGGAGWDANGGDAGCAGGTPTAYSGLGGGGATTSGVGSRGALGVNPNVNGYAWSNGDRVNKTYTVSESLYNKYLPAGATAGESSLNGSAGSGGFGATMSDGELAGGGGGSGLYGGGGGGAKALLDEANDLYKSGTLAVGYRTGYGGGGGGGSSSSGYRRLGSNSSTTSWVTVKDITPNLSLIPSTLDLTYGDGWNMSSVCSLSDIFRTVTSGDYLHWSTVGGDGRRWDFNLLAKYSWAQGGNSADTWFLTTSPWVSTNLGVGSYTIELEVRARVVKETEEGFNYLIGFDELIGSKTISVRVNPKKLNAGTLKTKNLTYSPTTDHQPVTSVPNVGNGTVYYCVSMNSKEAVDACTKTTAAESKGGAGYYKGDKGKDDGKRTYYVHYYAKATNSNFADSDVKVTSFTVERATPIVSTNGIKARSGAVYCNSDISLFEGSVSMKHSSTDNTSVSCTFAYCKYKTDGVTKISEASYISGITAKEVNDVCRLYVYFTPTNLDCYNPGWVMNGSNYFYATSAMKKHIQKSDGYDDGLRLWNSYGTRLLSVDSGSYEWGDSSHSLASITNGGPKYYVNKTDFSSVVSIGYKYRYSTDDGKTWTDWETCTYDKKVSNIGKYQLRVDWSATDNIAASTDSRQPSTFTYDSVVINRVSASSIILSGLTFNSTKEITTNTGNHMFTSGTNLSANFKKKSGNSYVLGADLGLNEAAGEIYYILSTSSSYPAATSTSWTKLADANGSRGSSFVNSDDLRWFDLNAHYLYLKFKKYSFIEEDAVVRYKDGVNGADCYQQTACRAVSINVAALKTAVNKSSIYDGGPKTILSSGLTAVINQTALVAKISPSYTILKRTDKNTQVTPEDDPTHTSWGGYDTVNTKQNEGAYDVYIKWAKSNDNMVAATDATNGIYLGKYTINQLENFSSISLGGVSVINTGNDAFSASTDEKVYERIFDNKPHKAINYVYSNRSAKIGSSNVLADLGTLSFALSNADDINSVPEGEWVSSQTDVNNQQIKWSGSYYLYVKWNGNANIKKGGKKYAFSNGNVIRINKKSENSGITLSGIGVTTNDDVIYGGGWNGDETLYEGDKKSLFALAGDKPTILINGEVYSFVGANKFYTSGETIYDGVTFKYCVKTSQCNADDIPSDDNTIWSDKLPTPIDAGTYYLYVQMKINKKDNANLYNFTYQRYVLSKEIKPRKLIEVWENHKPMPVGDMFQLKNGSTGSNIKQPVANNLKSIADVCGPYLQYRLDKWIVTDDETNAGYWFEYQWVYYGGDNDDDMRVSSAGSYRFLWRYTNKYNNSSSSANKNFVETTVDETLNAGNYVEFKVTVPNGFWTTPTAASGLVYDSTAQGLLTTGCGWRYLDSEGFSHDMPVYYYVTINGHRLKDANNNDLRFDNFADVKAVDAGYYTVECHHSAVENLYYIDAQGQQLLVYPGTEDRNGGLTSSPWKVTNIKIDRATITVTHEPTVNGDHAYTATPQQLFDEANGTGKLSFKFNTALEILGNDTIQDGDDAYGYRGKIEYGFSTIDDKNSVMALANFTDRGIGSAARLENESYAQYCARMCIDVGPYYCWYRVWSGANHKGTDGNEYVYSDNYAEDAQPEWKFCGVRNIRQANPQGGGDGLTIGGYKWVNERVDFANRLWQMVDFDGDVVVTLMSNPVANVGGKNRYGTIYYAVTNSSIAPKTDDVDEDGNSVWTANITKAGAIHADIYYLHIKITETEWLAETIIPRVACRSTYHNTNTNTTEILKAKASDALTFAGINLYSNLFYNGRHQALASFSETGLSAKVAFTDNGTDGEVKVLDFGTVEYRFSTSNTVYNFIEDDNITPTTGWQSNLANATVLNCAPNGGYYLWIHVTGKNSDGTAHRNFQEGWVCYNAKYSVNLLKDVFTYDNSVIELQINNENYHNYFEDVVYNADFQRLIKQRIGLKLIYDENNELTGTYGGESYFINTTYIDYNQLTADEITEITASWSKNIITTIGGRDADTYYIYVKFYDGQNYESVPIQSYKIIINKASDAHVDFYNLSYEEGLVYNGDLQSLAKFGTMTDHVSDYNGLVIKIKDNNFSVTAEIPTNNIFYASSTNNDVAPITGWKSSLSAVKEEEYGYYFIWIKIKELPNFSEFTYCVNSISPILIDVANGDNLVFSGIECFDNLEYNGSQQILASGTLKVQIKYFDKEQNSVALNPLIDEDENINKFDGVSVQWGSTFCSSYEIDGDGKIKPIPPLEWKYTLNQVTREDVNQYYLWIKISGSRNFTNREYCWEIPNSNPVEYQKAVIKKAHAEFTVDPIGYSGLVYDPEHEQKLVMTGGISNFQDKNGGKVLYTLNKNPSLSSADGWEFDFDNLLGQDEGTYIVYYGVLDNPNWIGKIESIPVYIAPSAVRLSSAPTAKEDLVYNGSRQILINVGVLDQYSRDAGCIIEYSYTNTENSWFPESELLERGGINAGTYPIYYRTIAGNHNYKSSPGQGEEPLLVNAEIKKRLITMTRAPQGYSNLKQSGQPQPLVQAGELTAGGSFQYSNDKETWSAIIPEGNDAGIYYVWYRVIYDTANNEYFGESEAISVRIAKQGLFLRDIPSSISYYYDADYHDLVWGGTLSTFQAVEEMEPWIQYGVQDNTQIYDTQFRAKIRWLDKGEKPKAKNAGEYNIYFKVIIADERNFDFYGTRHGSFTSVINKRYIDEGMLSAVYDDGTLIPNVYKNYPDTLKTELSKPGVVTYQWRINDGVYNIFDNPDKGWSTWSNNNPPQAVGHYEVRACVHNNSNYWLYNQRENFDTFDISADLVVKINYEGTEDTRPSLRIWLDLTGNTTWNDAQYRDEGDGSDPFVFHNVNTTGKNNEGVIKLMYLYNGRYYYLSAQDIDKTKELSDRDTANYVTDSDYIKNMHVVNHVINTEFNICEVYRITYNANGGNAEDTPSQGWKWHNVPYQLAENNIENLDRINNGWNTTRSGSGTQYRSSSYYTDNASRIFYAQFKYSSEMTYIIRWVIGDYELSSESEWFFAGKLENIDINAGVEVLVGSKIMLPEIVDENFSSYKIYNKYISGWVTETGTPYSVGMIADDNYTFKAILKSPENRNDYVDYVFKDEDGNILKSTRVANGAESYMALSGLTAQDFKRYDFEQWAKEHKKELVPESTATGIQNELVYSFATAKAPEISDDGNALPAGAVTPGQMTFMIIIIAAGATLSIACVVVYLSLRKKNKIKIR